MPVISQRTGCALLIIEADDNPGAADLPSATLVVWRNTALDTVQLWYKALNGTIYRWLGTAA